MAPTGCFRSTQGERLAALLLAGMLLAPPLAAQRAAVEAKNGMVTCAQELASQVGVRILKQGGNAVDAGIATGLALAVVYPQAGNIGGGGFMVIHTAAGKDTVIDYRERAPKRATRDMYLGPDGKVIKGEGSSVLGWKAGGVPGTVAGFHMAFQKYGSGKVTWAELVKPAQQLAAGGFPITQGLVAALEKDKANLGLYAETKKIFLNDGKGFEVGQTWVQKDLGATLKRIQEDPRDFYEGRTAHLMVEAMAGHGGTIALEDLKAYRATEREPLRTRYRGYDIVTMPPPSSGGIVIAQILKMIEPYDVGAMGPGSAAKFHLFAEAQKRAYRDRAEYMGDTDFVQVQVAKLLDADYLKGRMADFDLNKATPAAMNKPGLGPFTYLAAPESHETTQFSVVDKAGNAVSNTYTINDWFGSRVTIPGAGFLLNNEMDDFTAKVGVPNLYGLLQSEANAIVPGKRPLSSMSPTIVSKDGRVLLVTGSPGGSTIINTVLEIITNVIDHKMPVMQAVEYPRFHNQWMPDLIFYERYGMSPDTIAMLTEMGYQLKEGTPWGAPYQGDGETVGVDWEKGLLLGASDPRNADGRAVGY
jgi:gamma-glutamyltranspeptidase / glutathione hydrolase